jgi:hypothetical protein
MIRYLKQSEIDYKKWDECISNCKNELIYAYSWYLDIVAGSWDALVDDDYISVMPLPFKKMGFIYKLYQPFFAQQLGVFSKNNIDDKYVAEFLNAIPRKYRLINITLNLQNNYNGSVFKKIKRRTYLLDLMSSYEELNHNFAKNNIRNINKTQKNELFYVEDASPDEIINAFKSNKGLDFSEIKEVHYKIIQQLTYSCINKGVAKIIKAYDNKNSFCAGVIFFIFGKKAIFIFSGATTEARENGAMFGIVNYFIKKFQQTEIVLDFEGSMDANLARFYSGFGAKECLFLQIIRNRFVI